jgi:hypothetical protein
MCILESLVLATLFMPSLRLTFEARPYFGVGIRYEKCQPNFSCAYLQSLVCFNHPKLKSAYPMQVQVKSMDEPELL